MRRDRNLSIDIGLAALCKHNTRGQQMTLEDMAYVCECDKERIRQIQESGLRKARCAIMELGIGEELIEQLRAMN